MGVLVLILFTELLIYRLSFYRFIQFNMSTSILKVIFAPKRILTVAVFALVHVFLC